MPLKGGTFFCAAESVEVDSQGNAHGSDLAERVASLESDNARIFSFLDGAGVKRDELTRERGEEAKGILGLALSKMGGGGAGDLLGGALDGMDALGDDVRGALGFGGDKPAGPAGGT